MGNVGGALKHIMIRDRTDPAQNHLIISEKLFKTTELMSISSDFREIFLKYFLSGLWVAPFVEEKDSLQWMSKIDIGDDHKKFANSILGIEKYFIDTDSSSDMSSSSSFSLSEIKNVNALLLALAIPYFLKSTMFAAWKADAEDDPVRKRITDALSSISFSGNGSEKILSKSGEGLDSEEKTVTARFSIEYSLRRSLSERTTFYPSGPSVASNAHEPSIIIDTKNGHINESKLQSMIMKQLMRIQCADVFQLVCNANQLSLRQLLHSILDFPYAIAISAVSPEFYDEVQAKHSKKDISRFFPIVYVNHGYEQLTQFSHADLQGFAINCLLDSSIAGEKSIEVLEESLRELKPLQMHMNVENRSGEVHNTLFATCPVFSSESVCSHMLFMHKPLTQLHFSSKGTLEKEQEIMRQLLSLLSAVLI